MSDWDGRELAEITADGRLRLHFHPGQWAIWQSDARFLLALAGTQGGKTSFGPHWLYREIQWCGPGDYITVTPTYPLLDAKALPEFLRLFDRWLGLGRFYTAGRKFVFSADGARRTWPDFDPVSMPDTRVIFGYATDPESLESAEAKAAWLDEVGQKKFQVGSWEAILRRLSVHMGRALLTTTPYNRGWLKTRVYDRWQAGDPNYFVSRFESRMNPVFPAEEWERARQDLPRWKFDMFYRGLFERPAGLIYDAFDEERCTIPRFALPDGWQRYLGLDFGGVNTAGMFYAEEPGTGRLYAYREYLAGKRTARQHVSALIEGEPMIPIAVGGSPSEGQWRQEFRQAGLPVRPPATGSVEVGIDRVYGAHRRNEIIAFDDLHGYLDEKASYSRKLDEDGEPTEEIEDKHEYHRMDAERYVVGWIKRPQTKKEVVAWRR